MVPMTTPNPRRGNQLAQMDNGRAKTSTWPLLVQHLCLNNLDIYLLAKTSFPANQWAR